MVKKPNTDTAGPVKSRVEIVDGVKQFRRFCQSVIDLADAVGDVDSLERAAREAENRMAETQAREAATNAALEAAQARLAQAEKKKAEADKRATEILTAAEQEATKIKADAK